MKKRIPGIVLTIALLVCLYIQPAIAATDESLFDWKPLPDGSGIELLHYNGTGIPDVVVPEKVDGLPVVSIAPDAFVLPPEGNGGSEPRTDIRTVYIPDTVTKIGQYAFWQLSALESIHLPAGLTELSDGVLCGCTSLHSLDLPAGITSVGTAALSGLESLEVLSLPSGIRSIGEAAFANDYALKSLELPGRMGEIPAWAFQNCTSLAFFAIPRSVLVIGQEAFAGCTSLSTLELPASVIGIGDLAFSNCPSLSTVVYSGNRRQFEKIYIQGSKTPEDCALLHADIQYMGNDNSTELPSPELPDGIYVAADSSLKLGGSEGDIYGVGYTAASSRLTALRAEFLEAQFIYPQEVSVVIAAPNGTQLAPEDVCGTGTTVTFLDQAQEPVATVTLVVSGDVTGSGIISLTQLVRMAQAMQGSVVLSGPYLAAGDFTDTGSITLTDLVRESQLLSSAH